MLLPQRTQVWFPALRLHFTVIITPVLDAHFYVPVAPGMCVVCIHIYKQNTQIHSKIKYLKIKFGCTNFKVMLLS